MYCRICGSNKSKTNLLSQIVCKECLDEISRTSVYDETYDQYKNIIRILLGYYISELHQLNPVN
ncbi:sigma factor G inhibitor Gin [Tissierella sp.]|uniref:sigma factor G inhibitor Gin n=1 Tax=Tissierella sp. TaxID=41274 RepID=UPI0028573043|nr:sigma factor G inhibitor Gin [Tissierella sp.]MDR7857617.1 sigma factor G inhibitor Gin [Tissierella sp.]